MYFLKTLIYVTVVAALASMLLAVSSMSTDDVDKCVDKYKVDHPDFKTNNYFNCQAACDKPTKTDDVDPIECGRH